jgi:uncharacterized membrane protein YgaE (UPF0421/DUF939 family)
MAKRRDWLVEDVWVPLEAGLLLAVVGAFGILAGRPWLFPSLGPTAFALAEYPDARMSRFYHVVLAHLIGLGAAILSVHLLSARVAPALPASGQIAWARVWAAALALTLTILLEALLRTSHPPSAATALIVALGGIPPTLHAAIDVIAGVIIVATLGELIAWIRSRRHPVRLAADAGEPD